MDLFTGRQIGQYIVESQIGQGTMGVVYRVHRMDMPENPIALKVLQSSLASDASFITRFNRESEALKKLRHPNIIKFLDGGQDSGMLYYAMEFISGTTVGTLIKEKGKLDIPMVIEIGIQIADALDYIHDSGHLIHRDIKPDNIIVDKWGRTKVLDFGLARMDGAYTITRIGMVVGSLYYVPPEQLNSERIDGRADIYALGVSLYEMTTGLRPFRGKTLQEMSNAIKIGNPVPPMLLEPTLPVELEHIILKALARRKEDRYEHARLMRDDLRMLQQVLLTESTETTELRQIPTNGHAFPQPIPQSQQISWYTQQQQYPDPNTQSPQERG